MEPTINKKLNQIFEILGLLYLTCHPEFMNREYLLQSASEYGINGSELYKKFGSTHKRYVTAFQKKALIEEEDTFYFEEDEDENLILILQTVLASHSHWLDEADTITEEEITLAFLNSLSDNKLDKKPDFSKIIEIMQSSGLTSNVCWKLTLILQDPKHRIKQLTDIILRNTAAYEQALLAVDKVLGKRLEDFPKGQYKITTSISKDAEIFPTLVYPAAEILDENNRGYIGLFVREAYQLMENAKNTKGSVIPMLKALSDKSKFDILMSLKHSPKYNMELAEQFGLTAATTSHHMGVLLSHDFVAVEKRDGRVYYTINRDKMKTLIEELEYLFFS